MNSKEVIRTKEYYSKVIPSISLIDCVVDNYIQFSRPRSTHFYSASRNIRDACTFPRSFRRYFCPGIATRFGTKNRYFRQIDRPIANENKYTIGSTARRIPRAPRACISRASSGGSSVEKEASWFRSRQKGEEENAEGGKSMRRMSEMARVPVRVGFHEKAEIRG